MASDGRKTKQELIAELEELRHASVEHERSRHELQTTLQERIRELRCLYAISELLHAGSTSLDDAFGRIVELLPTGCADPDACARLHLDGRERDAPGFHQTSLRQRSDIRLNGETIGFVEVGHPSRPEDGRGFLDQEQQLLDAIARKVARLIQLREAEERASAYHARLRQLASLLTLAEERQRRQLAHDLHDSVGSTLALAKLKLDTLADPRRSPDPAALSDVSALLQRTIEDCHSLMFQLSPPVLYESGLVAAIEWLADRYRQQFSLDVQLRAEHGRVPLGEDQRVMLYRAVSELLTNVVKHADTRSARVIVEKRAQDLSIRVEDDGKGFRCDELSMHSGGCGRFGLFSVRERLAHLGIRCEISTSPGHGTHVSLTAPLAS